MKDDLTERYLAAVAGQLPARKRTDILAELRDLILTRAEAREDELGRSLDRKEQAALLKELGHPFVVAAGYGEHQYLIGPESYPFYVFVLKLVLVIVAAVYLAGFVLAVIGAEGAPMELLQDSLVRSILVAVGAVTLVFWATDRSGAARRLQQKWRPERLPRIHRFAGRSRFETAFEAAFVTGFILWWVGVIDFPFNVGGVLQVELAPIWRELYWPILLYMAAQVAIAIFELVRGDMARTSAVLRMAWHLATLPIVYLLLQAGHWIEVSGATASAPILEANLDRGFYYGIWIGAVIALIEAARAALRLRRLSERAAIASPA